MTYSDINASLHSQWLAKGYLSSFYKTAVGRLKEEYEEIARLTTDKPDLHQSAEKAIKSIEEGEAILGDAATHINSGQVGESSRHLPVEDEFIEASF